MRRKKFTQDIEVLKFCFSVAIDVEGFSRRSGVGQARLQSDLASAMTRAAASAGLDRESWNRERRGDGELAILPEGVNGLSVVADYPRGLASVVAEINQPRPPESRLRVRLAIHHGATILGEFGPIWNAPIVVSRLIDAEILRQQLRDHDDLDVALIVSATVYEEIVLSRLHDLDPEAFGRAVIKVKGKPYIGYLYQGRFAASDRKLTVPRQQPIIA